MTEVHIAQLVTATDLKAGQPALDIFRHSDAALPGGVGLSLSRIGPHVRTPSVCCHNDEAFASVGGQ